MLCGVRCGLLGLCCLVVLTVFADGRFVLRVCSLCGLVMIYVLFVGYWIWF